MAGVLCVDIHDFDSQSSVEQTRSRAVLIDALRGVLGDMAPSSWWQVDVQHGILIVCPISPDDVMYLTQAMLHHKDVHRWRLGLHVSLLHAAPDLDGRAQTVGDGVARARRMAAQARPAHALASRAYVEAVRDSRPGYSALFEPALSSEGAAQSLQQAQGGAPEQWLVAPAPDWLVLLRNELMRRSLNSQNQSGADAQSTQPASTDKTRWMAEPLPATFVAGSGPAGGHADAAPADQTIVNAPPWTQARDLIAHWFVPANALLVSIGVLLSQGYRVGLTEQRLLWAGLILMLLTFVWLLLTRLVGAPAVKRSSAAAWLGLFYGALLSLSAITLVLTMPRSVSQPTAPTLGMPETPLAPTALTLPPTPSASMDPPGAATSAAAVLVTPSGAEVQPAAVRAPAPTASRATPDSIPSAVAKSRADNATDSTAERAKPPLAALARGTAMAPDDPSSPHSSSPAIPARTSAGRPTALANSGRCSAIVARSALGEPLSPEDRQELLTLCR